MSLHQLGLLLWKRGEKRREDEGALKERREGWRRRRTAGTRRRDGKIASEGEEK